MSIRTVAKLSAAAAVAVALVQLQPVAAQIPAADDYTTPGGIAFRHVSLPEETKHTLAFAWPEEYAISGAGRGAVAYLGPRLMLEGTTDMPRGEFIERMNDLQAIGDFKNNSLFATGYLSAPPANFAEAVTNLSALFSSPALSPERLAFLKKNGAQAIRHALEQPPNLGLQLMHRLVIGAHPVADVLMPSPTTYLSTEPADIVGWRNAVLSRDRVFVTSAGPISAEAVASEIDRLFGGLPAKAEKAIEIAPPKMRASGKLIVLERNVVQSFIVAGGPTGWVSGPDAVRARLAAMPMNGIDGRFSRSLRGKLGATYNVRAMPIRYHRNAFGFYIATAVDTAKTSDVIAAMRDEYAKLISDGITQKELDIAKTRRLTEVQEAFRHSGPAAALLNRALFSDRPVNHYETYEDALKRYDLAAINDGLRTKFPHSLTFLVITPTAEGLGADCVIKSPDEIAQCEENGS